MDVRFYLSYSTITLKSHILFENLQVLRIWDAFMDIIT